MSQEQPDSVGINYHMYFIDMTLMAKMETQAQTQAQSQSDVDNT
jgi:hypothetical protein